MVLTGTTILAVLGATLITGGAAALGNFIANEVIDIAKDIKKNKSLENTTENQKTNNWLETEEGKKETEIIRNNIAANEQETDQKIQKELEIAKQLEEAGKKFNWENETNTEEAVPPQPTNNPITAPIIDPIIQPTENQIPEKEENKQEIADMTDANTGTNTINSINWLSWAEEQQKKQWEREDAIRKEVQEREDTAYQRAIADMRKAGINPNLVGISPAQSGGGITQATGQDLTGLVNSMNIDADKLMQIIDNNFKGNENEKERLLETITNILSTVGMIIAFKKR